MDTVSIKIEPSSSMADASRALMMALFKMGFGPSEFMTTLAMALVAGALAADLSKDELVLAVSFTYDNIKANGETVQ